MGFEEQETNLTSQWMKKVVAEKEKQDQGEVARTEPRHTQEESSTKKLQTKSIEAAADEYEAKWKARVKKQKQ